MSIQKKLLALLCILTMHGIFGCNKDSEPPVPSNSVPFVPANTITVLKFLALGDSYTIGQGVAITERFPHQTVAKLSQSGRKFSEPDYIATTGWTTANLLSAISNADKPKNYDVVSLLIGVNNQYQGRDTAEYRQQFSQCLQQAITHAGNRKERVFVLSIPDYGVTPFARFLSTDKIAREIDAFNKINENISNSFGVNYIEITESSRQALNDPTLVATDGLHPSAKEYQKWAEKLATKILTVIR